VVLVLATNSVKSGFSVRKLSFEDRDSTGIDALEGLGDWKPGELGESWNKLRFPTNHAKLLAELTTIPGVRKLGDFASVEIGCVTGANHYFVLNKSALKQNSLPETFLTPAVSKATHLQGLFLRAKDWHRLFERDERCSLLNISRRHPAARSKFVQRYLSAGRKAGIRERYKTSHRERWFEVPAYRPPSGLFTYMSHEYPRLVVNSARAINTNSIHSVRIGVRDKVAFCAAFYNSLTLISCELLGRVYSGGVLKLEPSELEQILVIDPEAVNVRQKIETLGDLIDERLTRRDLEGVLDLVDPVVLMEGLGLSETEIASLRGTYSDIRRARMQD
jgi:adenine-specific DNA-methyltransferase